MGLFLGFIFFCTYILLPVTWHHPHYAFLWCSLVSWGKRVRVCVPLQTRQQFLEHTARTARRPGLPSHQFYKSQIEFLVFEL